MMRTLAIAVAFAIATHCHADDAAENQAYTKQDIVKLLSRIKQLERRVATLEERQTPRLHTAPWGNQPPNADPHPSPVQPIPPNPGPNQNPIIPPAYGDPLQPIAPSPDNAPQTWQRFNFNGQWFYIIPVEQANANAAHTD